LDERDSYQEWQPPPQWQHVVSCCWEQYVANRRIQRVIPDGHADVLLWESGLIEVVGLQDHVALPELPAGTRIHGIRLRPEAVAAAFRLPADQLRNVTVTGDDVLGSHRARDLADPLLLDTWIRSIEPDYRTTVATSLLRTKTVSETAGLLDVSPRQLRRVFLTNVGLGPKTYQRVLRLQSFITAAAIWPGLASAAAAAGYADQAHLTREVKELAGLTPAKLLEERDRTE
jgi:AraC-like DNA-binding protein